jgi:hypothetical protein
MKQLRNADFQEVTLEAHGQTLLRFALSYGFRNIQTVVRCPACPWPHRLTCTSKWTHHEQSDVWQQQICTQA